MSEERGIPLSGRELRRYERATARRFCHEAISHRRCGDWRCMPCWWRSLTGQHRRHKRALVELGRKRLDETSLCAHDWELRTYAGRAMPPLREVRDGQVGAVDLSRPR